MIYEASWIAILLFLVFVALVLVLSFYFAAKTKSASGYFAAGGTIHWAVNGIAFAGDYLSAASFLGICGMIAFQGYDGFLYSIGYLAGWIVALFLVAEPLKRLGKYTFADALDAKFNSRSIQLMAAISTLVVSLFYLIPQMVGAGALVRPLLDMPHYVGVLIVGAIVILIVATAGMTSTTYVQFIKGGLLIIFSTILAVYIFNNGLNLVPDHKNQNYHEFTTLNATVDANGDVVTASDGWVVKGNTHIPDPKDPAIELNHFVKLEKGGIARWFDIHAGTPVWKYDTIWTTEPAIEEEMIAEDAEMGEEAVEVAVGEEEMAEEVVAEPQYTIDSTEVTGYTLVELLSVTTGGEEKLYNGLPMDSAAFFQVGHLNKIVMDGEEVDSTGAIGPLKFLSTIEKSEVVRFLSQKFKDDDKDVTVWYQQITSGKELMIPGLKFKKIKSDKPMDKLNFISLMIALFLGTASLPHILIRYYTVPSQKDARKSTILAIAAIGFFYILTLFMGLGASVNGVLDVESSNMSGPLLAKAFGVGLFAIISAIAFATILGTVSGLIVASSGAIAHDFIDRYLRKNLSDKAKVRAGKIAAFAVGGVAIVLGILFKGMNVSFLVGWAFAVAASANLPAILMVLFWKKTTAKGIAWSIVFGIVAALGIILTGPTMGEQFWGIPAANAIQPLDNPAIISFTLALVVLIVVSLMTQKDNATKNHNPEQQ